MSSDPAGATTPTVGVVVPARDAGASLAAAVASALAQRPRPDRVVVAVGPSADDTAAVAAGLAAGHGVVVVDNPSGTTPAALNAALAACDTDVVVRLDAHAVLPDGYVATALEALASDPRIGNVGGRQVPIATGGFAAAVARAMASPVGAGGATYRTGTSAGPTDTVYLGVFRRQALLDVGGFDEVMRRNQDYELNVRLRAAGWTVWFDPRLEVAYTPRGSVAALARQYRDYGRFRRLTARRHPGTLRLRQLAAPVLVVGLVLAALVSTVLGTPLPFLAAGAGYLLLLAVAGVRADARRTPSIVLALLTMHLSWGLGFLLGPPRDARAPEG